MFNSQFNSCPEAHSGHLLSTNTTRTGDYVPSSCSSHMVLNRPAVCDATCRKPLPAFPNWVCFWMVHPCIWLSCSFLMEPYHDDWLSGSRNFPYCHGVLEPLLWVLNRISAEASIWDHHSTSHPHIATKKRENYNSRVWSLPYLILSTVQLYPDWHWECSYPYLWRISPESNLPVLCPECLHISIIKVSIHIQIFIWLFNVYLLHLTVNPMEDRDCVCFAQYLLNLMEGTSTEIGLWLTDTRVFLDPAHTWATIMVNWAEDLKVNFLAEHFSWSSSSSHNLMFSWVHCFLFKVFEMVAVPFYHSKTRKNSGYLPYLTLLPHIVSLFPKTPSALKLTWYRFIESTISVTLGFISWVLSPSLAS